MKRLMLVMCFVVGANVAAQERRSGGPPPYDATQEVTVSATTVGVETITPPDRPTQVVLMVTAEGKPLGIFMGPQEWFAKQNFAPAKGAAIEILGLTGYKYNGNPAMTPRVVKSGGKTLTLRDAKGVPVWVER